MNRRKLMQSLLSTVALTAIPGASVIAAVARRPSVVSSGGLITIQDYAHLVVDGDWTAAFNAAIRDAAGRAVYLPSHTEYRGR